MTNLKPLPSAGSASVCSNLSALQDETSPSAHRWDPSGAGWNQEKAVTGPLLACQDILKCPGVPPRLHLPSVSNAVYQLTLPKPTFYPVLISEPVPKLSILCF